MAQKRETDGAVPVGEPLIVIVQKKDLVAQFSDFKFDGQKSQSQSQPKQEASSQTKK